MRSFRRWLPVPLVALAVACELPEGGGEPSSPDATDAAAAPLDADADAAAAGPLADDARALAGELGCARHADCASDLCRHATGALDADGSCVPEARVLYVDRARCSPGADGSRARPFCSLRAAVAAADAERFHLRVYPGFQRPFTVSGKRVRIYGSDPGDPPVEVTEEDLDGTVVTGGARVLLDGLALGRHSRFGVACQGGATLVVRRGEIASDVGVGLIATDCSLRLDRVRASGRDGALLLTGATYLVTSTLVSGASEGPALALRGGAGRILLTTVTGNGDPAVGAPAVACSGGASLVDSIVFGNAPAADGSQLAGDCRLTRVVVGRADRFPAAGAIRLDPDLEPGRLPASEANRACCIDRAPVRDRLDADLAGTARPQGDRFDLGAFEAR